LGSWRLGTRSEETSAISQLLDPKRELLEAFEEV